MFKVWTKKTTYTNNGLDATCDMEENKQEDRGRYSYV